jgi:hypothetical protein
VTRPRWSTVVTSLIVAGVAFSWFYWTAGCAYREGERQTWWDVCQGTYWVYVPWLSFLALPFLVTAWWHHRRTGQTWPLIAAIVVAVVAALSTWVVFGDPAGNFDGLRTQ